MPRIICAGLIAVDMVFDVAAFPAKGTKIRATSSQMISGGGGLNAASAIAQLGGAVSLVGAIGSDDFATFLRAVFADRQIDAQLVTQVQNVPTARSAIVVTPDGDRTIVNHRDPGLAPRDVTFPNGFAFDAALVDTRWPAGAAQIVQAAMADGKPAVVDAEAPLAEANDLLQLASHVVFSQQGLADFCDGSDAAALELAQKRLGNWCAVTRGTKPVLCHDGKRMTQVATYASNARNTLGAGDVWHGAFALALANNVTEIDAARWANAAASLKVSRPIDDSTLPTASDVDSVVATQSFAKMEHAP